MICRRHPGGGGRTLATEQSALQDAKRVSQIVRRISSASDRQSLIALLSEFDTLVDLADALAERRIVPFPSRVGSLPARPIQNR